MSASGKNDDKTPGTAKSRNFIGLAAPNHDRANGWQVLLFEVFLSFEMLKRLKYLVKIYILKFKTI